MSTAILTQAYPGHANRSLFDSLVRSACTMQLRAAHASELAGAQLKNVQLGAVNLVHYRAVGIHTAERTRGHIIEDRARYFFMCVPLGARYTVTYRGHVEEVPPQSFVLLSSDTPFRTEQCGVTLQSEFAAAVVRLPAAPLRSRIAGIDDLCGRSIPMPPGLASAIGATVQWALAVNSLDEQSAHSIGAGLFDMICDYVDQVYRSTAFAEQGRTSLDRTYERARSFIEQNLRSPTLSVADVAKHCGVSTRYLQLAFASQLESAAHVIRERRLQKCRQALLDQAQSRRSVIEIAASWGFTDACHFSRTYKMRFGVAPSVDRSSLSMTPPHSS